MFDEKNYISIEVKNEKTIKKADLDKFYRDS